MGSFWRLFWFHPPLPEIRNHCHFFHPPPFDTNQRALVHGRSEKPGTATPRLLIFISSVMFTDASHWLHRPRYCCIYDNISTCNPLLYALSSHFRRLQNCTSHHYMHTCPSYLGRKHFTYGKFACRLFTKERKGGGGGKGADGEVTCIFFAKESLSFVVKTSKNAMVCIHFQNYWRIFIRYWILYRRLIDWTATRTHFVP